MRRTIVLVSVVILLLSSQSAASARISAPTYETQIKKQTNTFRSAHGRAKISHSACLDRWAESWARKMAREKRLVHRDKTIAKVMNSCKLRVFTENLARGYSTGTATVRAWEGSSGHRANLLNSSVRLHAAAAYPSGGTWWVVQIMGQRR